MSSHLDEEQKSVLRALEQSENRRREREREFRREAATAAQRFEGARRKIRNANTLAEAKEGEKELGEAMRAEKEALEAAERIRTEWK